MPVLTASALSSYWIVKSKPTEPMFLANLIIEVLVFIQETIW